MLGTDKNVRIVQIIEFQGIEFAQIYLHFIICRIIHMISGSAPGPRGKEGTRAREGAPWPREAQDLGYKCIQPDIVLRPCIEYYCIQCSL